MTERLRPCRRCLLDGLGEPEYFKSIYEYIDSLPAERKACDVLYKSRLAVCLDCNGLLNGMCRECGCFVEVRAIIKKNRCPIGRWYTDMR